MNVIPDIRLNPHEFSLLAGINKRRHFEETNTVLLAAISNPLYFR
ncbi:hypothetical protein NNL21_28630 [Paenibacillus mendelii]|nr:hypothetical protein [Paenibacillus mendelii]